MNIYIRTWTNHSWIRRGNGPPNFFKKRIEVYILVLILVTSFNKITFSPLIISLIIIREKPKLQTFLQHFYKLLR